MKNGSEKRICIIENPVELRPGARYAISYSAAKEDAFHAQRIDDSKGKMAGCFNQRKTRSCSDGLLGDPRNHYNAYETYGMFE